MELELSAGEWKLMNRLWQQSPQTITQLVAGLKEQTGWTKHTVITMLHRLEAKGAVRYRAGGRAKLYEPAVERRQIALQETETFLQKVYSGSLGMLVNACVQGKGITEEERRQLYEILKATEEGGEPS